MLSMFSCAVSSPESESFTGEWFTPHAAFVKIILKDNGSFDFFNYDSVAGREVCLEGKYEKNQNKIILLFQDKKQINLSLSCDEIGNYYLINEDFYFVKSD
jgi:hypothetical protein